MLRYQVRVVGVMEGQRAENWVVVICFVSL